MIRAAIVFFVLAIVAYVLGLNGVAGLSAGIGQLLLFVFLIFAVVSLVASMLTGNKNKTLP